MSSIHNNPILMFTISVSIFGMLVVLMFAFNPPLIHEDFFWRKPLIGSIFSLICILGIFAALFPKQCSKRFHFQKDETNFTSHQISATSKGHHPGCGEFSSHVIHVGGYTICAACTGLLLGAIIAFIATAFFLFGELRMGEMSFPAVLIGVTGLVLGFFQLKFRGIIRSMLNVFFVFGAFLILAGIDELVKSLIIDLFLTVLIVFWLSTRIRLSQWDHRRICINCKNPCEVQEPKKG